jgi:hypothetical protein
MFVRLIGSSRTENPGTIIVTGNSAAPAKQAKIPTKTAKITVAREVFMTRILADHLSFAKLQQLCADCADLNFVMIFYKLCKISVAHLKRDGNIPLDQFNRTSLVLLRSTAFVPTAQGKEGHGWRPFSS